ncbi:cytochrome c oxidase subunit 1 [Solimonas aquatica]|uniref:Cytochrome c oxidase subunit 1 n=1 Tax=Solimonas aquatica TaxID=489703 RepID=A0A1H9ABG5_9GAMM|nr:cbb3-type cytochrome c oxidase subunit I [Solimonas aquatica]SEP73338.1 cytochrome c oxidase subunit 1 [Solimonas aquatica]
MNTTTQPSPDTSTARLAFQLYAAIGIAVFLLMMVGGATLRATQAAWMPLAPNFAYQLLTLHGAGMVGTAGLAGAAVMWYFLRRHVPLSTGMFLAMLGLSLVGVVMILAAIGLGGYAGAWTFLYPLPAKGMVWGVHAAAGFAGGLVLIGVGFLLFYLDCALALLKRYGSLWRALGLNQLFGSGPLDKSHPPTVVASTMVIIVNVLGILAGAVVLIMTLVNLYLPSVTFDPLLMKNLIFFFGHVFINATIYMAVIGVYEILPRYTGRPWTISRPFLAAWLAITLMVMAVYPHHLLMDYVLPKWMTVTGQVLSYCSGIPVLLVTAIGTLVNIHRSGIKWDLPSRLLVFSIFGWSAGVIPAVIDGVVRVNLVMHNTLWVPGHFHFYLLLGLLPMLLGTLFWACTRSGWKESALDRAAFWTYGVAGTGFCLAFLFGGMHSVPRRFAVYDPAWIGIAQVGTVAATLVLAAAVILGLRLLTRLPRASLTA